MDIEELKSGKVIKMVLKLYFLYYDPDTTKYCTGSGGIREGKKGREIIYISFRFN